MVVQVLRSADQTIRRVMECAYPDVAQTAQESANDSSVVIVVDVGLNHRRLADGT